MPTELFNEISREAAEIHSEILLTGEEEPEILSLYRGCQLLFSPLLNQPKILLIGFNPGGGYFRHHGSVAENFEPMQAMEYYLNRHHLGEQTKELFVQAGREEDLKHATVKTNFYYWATDNVTDFNLLLKSLPEELRRKIFHFARLWTKKLIDGLRPEMVIAEGFKTFDEIAILFPEKREEEKKESYKSFLTPEGMKVLGYKRNQGSIIGKEEVKNAINVYN